MNINEDIKNNNFEKKGKNYYSLNLTEGRIFIIFIAVLIVITIISFSIALIISKNNRPSNLNSNANIDNPSDKKNNYSFHTELDKEIKDNESIIENSDNISLDENENKINEAKIKIKEKNNNQSVEKINNDSVKLDNKEVLYSSKHAEKNFTPKINSDKIKEKKPENIKVSKKQYIVQIGSYTSKKNAEDIIVFYKMQGYPAFLIEKKEGEKLYYRLRIGPYSEKQKAEEQLTSLKNSKYGANSYISVVYM